MNPNKVPDKPSLGSSGPAAYGVDEIELCFEEHQASAQNGVDVIKPCFEGHQASAQNRKTDSPDSPDSPDTLEDFIVMGLTSTVFVINRLLDLTKPEKEDKNKELVQKSKERDFPTLRPVIREEANKAENLEGAKTRR
jgi:hypothetical protein